MNLGNVNKKALIIAATVTALLVLWYIISPNTSIIILIMILSIPLLVALLEFLKNISRSIRGGKLKRHFFNIYWKKNLLFLLIFIISDIASVFLLSSSSFDIMGFPIPYYSHYWQDPSPSFSPIFFIFDILFWYTILGLIVKQPMEINKNVVKLNYIILVIVLLIMFYYFSPLILKSQIVMF